MKTSKIRTIVIATTILLFTGSSIFAQRGMHGMTQGKGMNFQQNNTCVTALDLSDEQQTQIEALRLSHIKNMQANRNKMNELRAHKQTLMSSDSDLNDVNTVIDEMSDLHKTMMKASAKHRKEVRSLLNDKQKLIFDNHKGRGSNKGYSNKNNCNNKTRLGHGLGAGCGNVNK
ncbi:MAG: Spy/CpxP family protein refolding chaperone [Bacteroidales bacterium]|jgi:Spy/CpxP family protein refolding chaperone|nr:Spy/CpxP family protein refolding chaperone [Bacteroidales bacterium]